MAKKQQSILDVPCEYGGVSIGKETARIGLVIERSDLALGDADELLCGKRITGRIIGKPRGELQGQGHLVPVDEVIEGTFDVKRIGFNSDAISFGATYPLSSIDVSELAKFAKRIGSLVAESSDAIPEDAPDEHEEEDVPTPRRRRTAAKKNDGKPVVANDAGALMPLMSLKRHGLTPHKIKLIEGAAGGSTIGHFEQMLRSNPWWHRDIKGMGQDAVDKATEALVYFRAEYPVPAPQEVA